MANVILFKLGYLELRQGYPCPRIADWQDPYYAALAPVMSVLACFGARYPMLGCRRRLLLKLAMCSSRAALAS